MDITNAEPIVLDTLTRACSQNAEILKPAETQLRQWETQPGFYSALMSIFSNHSIDINVRWLAVLYFKNGIDRYWRKMAPNAISEEEKVLLRQRLICNFNEPVHQLALQVAVLIAKIARLDCPRNWPELIPTLLQAVRSEEALRQQRALLTLHHVTKMLASKRLASDRRVFEEGSTFRLPYITEGREIICQLTSNIFGYLLTLWNEHTESFMKMVMAAPHASAKGCHDSIDNSILTLKVLRKLVSYGFRDPQKEELPIMLINLVFQRAHEFLKSKHQLEVIDMELLPKREKIITLLTKVLLDMQEVHPETYIQFIQRSLEMAVSYSFTDAGTGLIFERFTVNAFNLIRSILRSETYRPAKNIEETKNPLTLEAYRIKMAFFTSEMLTEVCRRLVHNYFQLTVEDLQIWDSEPEDFIIDEGGDSWKFSLRPCTENLYLTMMKEFRDVLAPCVVSLVQACQGPVDPNDMAGILGKDAVYNAVGQASFDLYDEVDFNQWFTTHLLQELQNKHTNYRIIRRRVIWLIGCWTGVKLAPELRPLLYQAINPLLQRDEDLVVRIETVLSLKYAVDDFEFKTEQFFPYLESTFGLLFQVLKDVEECETKMQVLHVISFLIERMEASIRPYAGALIQYLPMLWQESADHNMLRCAILTTLINLVQGLTEQCVTMYDFLLPVIQLSTDVSQEPHVYLLEDGLDLWLVTLQCSPAITPALLGLYDNMPSLLDPSWLFSSLPPESEQPWDVIDYGTETLKTCLKIIESYVLMGPKEFMQKYSSSLVQSLSSLLTDLRSEGIIMVMKLVELIFTTFPEEGPRVFSEMLPQLFNNVLNGHFCPMECALYMSLIARIMLQNQPFFFDTIDHIGKQLSKESADLLGVLLDCWIEKADNLTQPERKKLSAMALLSLVRNNMSVVLERFGNVVSVCVETLHDVCRTEGDSNIDVLVINQNDNEEFETPHDRRKKQLSLRDPVMTVNLRDFVIAELTRCQQQHGPAGFNQLMELVDPDISRQLQDFIRNGRNS